MDAGELLGPSQQPSQEESAEASVGLHEKKPVDQQ
jgi:hypothetical protein